MKDVQATYIHEKALALERENPALQKHEIFVNFFIFCGLFSFLDPDPDPADQNQCGS